MNSFCISNRWRFICVPLQKKSIEKNKFHNLHTSHNITTLNTYRNLNPKLLSYLKVVWEFPSIYLHFHQCHKCRRNRYLSIHSYNLYTKTITISTKQVCYTSLVLALHLALNLVLYSHIIRKTDCVVCNRNNYCVFVNKTHSTSNDTLRPEFWICLSVNGLLVSCSLTLWVLVLWYNFVWLQDDYILDYIINSDWLYCIIGFWLFIRWKIDPEPALQVKLRLRIESLLSKDRTRRLFFIKLKFLQIRVPKEMGNAR